MVDIVDWLPEFKVSAESDNDLMGYFVKTPLIAKLLTGGKWMAIGRKGTGKTALFEFLRQASPKEISGYKSIPLNFENYPWPVHKLYHESMESEISAYQRSWKYIIIVKAISGLIEDFENRGVKLTRSLKEAKNIIEKIFGSPNPSLGETLKSKVLGLKSLSLPGVDIDSASFTMGSIEFEDIAAHETLQRQLRSNAFTLLEFLDKVYIENCKNTKQLIILDKLDENWLGNQLDDYAKILVNLILCAQTINNSVAYSSSLRIIIFLRTDIYSFLKFNDKTKIYKDGAVEIKWDHTSLDEMIVERIQKYAPPDLKLDYENGSAAIFENKTVRHGVSPLKHMLRRSFYRPRDVIVYLNTLRDLHKANASGLYTSKELYFAEPAVSANLYGELLDEWESQKPKFVTFLNTLQNIGLEVFTKQEYFDKYLASEPNATEADVNEILKFLFDNSIIGQKVSINWQYICTNPHMQIDVDKPFHVNNGLKSRLVLTEKREKRTKKAP